MPDMHRARFPRLLHRHAIGLDLNGRGRCAEARASRAPSGVRGDGVERRGLGQRRLPLQGRLELMCHAEPGLDRGGFETAERTDDALARSLGSLNRFDEEVVGVGLVFVAARGLTQIHSPLMIALHPVFVNADRTYFSHYFAKHESRITNKGLSGLRARNCPKDRGSWAKA